MTTRCPDGHESLTDDYCDVCGASLGPASATPAPAPESQTSHESQASATSSASSKGSGAEACPVCATARGADDAFCEACGFDFGSGAAAAAIGVWQVTITADRAYFDRVATEEMIFPVGLEPRVHVLDAAEVSIGRGSRSQGVRPDIDLGADVEDPGVSHRHARLVRHADGSYAVIDDASTNGTTINDDPAPIPSGAPIRLQPGDRVHLGAWTTLCIDVSPAEPAP